MRRFALTMALLLLGPPATPAFAGVADSPLPVLEAGKTTYHVYTVPGAMDAALATYFACTSLETTATIRVGVELFFGGGGAPANDATATSLLVAPGGTVRFGTQNAAGFLINSDLGRVATNFVSARILATSKKLACTAFVADPINAPPTSMVQLTIIKKTQKGD